MTTSNQKTFLGHPRDLSTLFFTEMWERFSFYGMRAFLILFMVAPFARGGLGMDTKNAASIYGWYTSIVYVTALAGGWLADRVLGAARSVMIGGIVIAIGHFTLAFQSLVAFYSGLALIVIGTGLLKPNVSTLVGTLYEKNDARRDAGFTLFYMGINIGAFLGPLVSGYLAEKVSWHLGFASAGIGMTFGVLQFLAGWKKFKVEKESPSVHIEMKKEVAPLTKQEKERVFAIIVLFVFAALFWGAFEQAGSSLNLFADRYTDNRLFGIPFPTSYHQALNPFFIITMAPLFSLMWIRMGDRQPSSPFKFAYGLLFVALGFLVIALAAMVGDETNKVSPMWLTGLYFLHTVGELCLSPVGLSIVTKLSPPRYVGMMMGGWFLAAAAGNKLGGWVAGYFDTFPLPKLFGAVFLTTLIAAIVLFALIKPIKRLMGEVK